VSELFPTEVFRLALIGKEINQQINFDPEGDTVPILYDQYDRLAGLLAEGVEDDFTRLYHLCHMGEARTNPPQRFLPRFSQVAYMVQMPHVDIHAEVAGMKEDALGGADVEVLEERALYAKHWLHTYAPERYKFEIQDTLPDEVRIEHEVVRAAVAALHAYVGEVSSLEGQELHTKLHEIKVETGVEPRALFEILYRAFLNTTSGPKAGWFLSVLEKEFVEKRLQDLLSA
jgi:lysyl-tRNA synthetase class 1